MTKKKKQNTFTFPMYQWGTNEYGFPVNTTHNWKSTSSISKKASKNKSRKTVYKSISGNIYTTEKEAVNDNEQYLSDPLYRFNYKSTNLPHYDPLFIPFIEDKRVTLSDAGLATGAVISTNLLDSIAKYAEQAGLPIKTALGLATKESTLGNPTDDSSVVKLIGKDKALAMQRGQTGQHLNTTGAAIDARELVNYYKDTWNPYEIAIEVAKRKSSKLVPDPDGNVYDSKGNIVGTRFYHDDPGYEEYKQEKGLAEDKRRQVLNDILLSGEKYADNLAEKYKDKIKGNILEAAFVDYKNNPHGYNPGQPNYSELVERRASEVWNSPEVQAWYNDYKNQKADGGSLNSKTWNDLSLSEKSEMMRVAIENGITTLPEIREAYNEFAKGGYAPSGAIKDRIIAYEGKAMTGAKDPVTGKWGKNNSFESEAARFYSALPDSIRNQVLSNPELADNLYSYSYNVGAGNFKKRVVPALERYYAGEGSIKDIENSMWASNDVKLRGLQRRRAEEKEGVRNALLGEAIPSLPVEQELPTFMPYNPQAFFAPLESYQRPVVVEEPLVQAAMENPYSPEQLEREERAQGLRNLGLAMSIMRGGQEQSYSPLWSAVSMLSGNQMAKGGKIHIKPENRGKFTALKKRTGHSATWFKQHGTPAQKKMATFALNAKKWKHSLGGNLFSGEDTPTQQMKRPVTTGGAGYVPTTSSSDFIDNTVLNLSGNIMSKLQNWWYEDPSILSGNESEELNGGIAQRTFLAGRRIQENEFKKHGFIKDTSGNYGLVKKAVGSKEYPIWQRTPDEISRSNLIPIGSTEEGFTGIPQNKNIIHGGSYPTAYYVDPSTVGFDFESGKEKAPRFYAKSWDLNDYGGKGGSTAGILGKALDFIGNPVVQTTGYIDITDSRPKEVDNMLEDYLYEKGLVKHRFEENNPYSPTFYGLPEVTVYGKKKKK